MNRDQLYYKLFGDIVVMTERDSFAIRQAFEKTADHYEQTIKNKTKTIWKHRIRMFRDQARIKMLEELLKNEGE